MTKPKGVLDGRHRGPRVGAKGAMREDFTEPVVCPRCEVNWLPIGYPGALSRADNTTEVCSPCGLAEAMESWGPDHRPSPLADWPVG